MIPHIKWTDKHLGSEEPAVQYFCPIFFLVLWLFTMVYMRYSGREEIQVLDFFFWKVTEAWEIYCVSEKLLHIYMDDKSS